MLIYGLHDMAREEYEVHKDIVFFSERLFQSALLAFFPVKCFSDAWKNRRMKNKATSMSLDDAA